MSPEVIKEFKQCFNDFNDWLKNKKEASNRTPDKFIDHLQEMASDEMALIRSKGTAYRAGESDPLTNFISAAYHLDKRPSEICMVYLWKHIAAVFDGIGREGVSVSGESLQSHIQDARNYLGFLSYILAEGVDEDVEPD